MKILSIRPFAITAAALTALPVFAQETTERDPLNYTIDDSPLPREERAAVTSYSAVLQELRPSVVSVFSRRVIEGDDMQIPPRLRRFFGEGGPGEGRMPDRVQQGMGSGFIISPNGYILTNNHVIEGADEVAVVLDDGRELDAEVIGADPQTDVAVIQIEADDLSAAVLGDSEQAMVGDVVFALGNPLGVGHSVTTGIISARGRSEIGILGEGGFEDFIQTDAAMNVGNSGGPLVDALGRVLGINTAIASPSGGNIGIGFVVPINLARNVAESLIEFGEVRRGFVGIQMQGLTPELREAFETEEGQGGALVAQVLPDSPAEEAGLQSGDVILEINGEPVESPSQVRLQVGQMRPGTSVEFGLMREGEPITVSVDLGRQEGTRSRPNGGGGNLLEGLVVEPLNPEHRERLQLEEDVEGLLVTSAAPRSPYAEALPPGTVILQINRQPVTTLAQAREAMRNGRNLVLVQQGEMLAFVVVDTE